MRSWRNDKLWTQFGCDRFWFLLVLLPVCMSKIECGLINWHRQKWGFFGFTPFAHHFAECLCKCLFLAWRALYVKREVGRNSLFLLDDERTKKYHSRVGRKLKLYLVWNVPETIPTYVEAQGNLLHTDYLRLYFSKSDIEISGGSEKRTKTFGQGD